MPVPPAAANILPRGLQMPGVCAPCHCGEVHAYCDVPLSPDETGGAWYSAPKGGRRGCGCSIGGSSCVCVCVCVCQHSAPPLLPHPECLDV